MADYRRGVLLRFLPPCSSPDLALLCRELQTSLSIRYGAMMDRGWGQGLSGEGIMGRRGSPAAPPSLLVCGDMDLLKDLFTGVGLKSLLNNGK